LTLTTERTFRWLDPEYLNINTRRYLADLLIGYLRDDRWELRVDKTMVPIEAPGELPTFSSLGVGRSDPPGSSHVLTFTAPPLYELGIPKHLVMLDAGDYNRWCRGEAYTYLPHLDRLLHFMHGNARVFFPELSGYGTRKQLKLRRSKNVSKEQGEAALSLLDICSLAFLG